MNHSQLTHSCTAIIEKIGKEYPLDFTEDMLDFIYNITWTEFEQYSNSTIPTN
jgi:hypothetical protein